MFRSRRTLPRRLPILALALLAASASGGALAAATAELAMLTRIEPGSWVVRVRDDSGVVRGQGEQLCLRDARRLIQLRHPGAACRSVVVEDEPTAVTVHYTCPGGGYGRTRLRLETARLVQIDSQGIAGGFPFDFQAEARRAGSCTSA